MVVSCAKISSIRMLSSQAIVQRKVSYARRETRANRRRYEAAIASLDGEAMLACRDRLLHGFSARLCALADARCSAAGGFSPVGFDELITAAEGLSLDGPGEGGRPFVINRGKAPRLVTAFGPRDRARHHQLGWVIKPLVMPLLLPSQFALGGGRDAATSLVASRIASGAKWALEIDIRQFFPSIDGREVLRALGLPTGIVGAVFSNAPAQRYAAMHTQRTANGNRRGGLPTGASISSILGEFVVSRILADVPDGPDVVFVDNMLFLGASRVEVELRAQAVVDAFARHPLGPFSCQVASPLRVSSGFDFLGYRHRSGAGRVAIRPTAQNVRKCVSRIREADPDARARTAAHWLGGFALWPQGTRFIQTLVYAANNDRPMTQRQASGLIADQDEPRFKMGPWT
jgi:hypothetical protein